MLMHTHARLIHCDENKYPFAYKTHVFLQLVLSACVASLKCPSLLYYCVVIFSGPLGLWIV